MAKSKKVSASIQFQPSYVSFEQMAKSLHRLTPDETKALAKLLVRQLGGERLYTRSEVNRLIDDNVAAAVNRIETERMYQTINARKA